jgi:hypothetical protein
LFIPETPARRTLDSREAVATFEEPRSPRRCFLAAKYILGVLGVLFLMVATLHQIRAGRAHGRRTRAWWIVGLLFIAMSLWLGMK